MQRIYMCIDLKTFYASVECVVRGLDPFKTNLVVADPTRGKGGLCLAISPKMKAQGIRNRCRIFEIPEGIDYIVATPRMNLYMQYSADIYAIYLKYAAKEDVYMYSIDEAFIDLTPYLHLYQKRPLQIARMIIDDVFQTTGITAAAGLGTNLYLAKIAMDITAKHAKSNLGCLTEDLFKKTLWHHQPLTDFWQIGHGIAKRLEHYGIVDMWGIANCDPRLLYREFGVNAKYLIDHANGIEPTMMSDIKKYKSKHTSMSNSQILFEDYGYEDAFLVLKEMVELNVLSLVGKHLVTNKISLYVGYSKNVIKASGGTRKISTTTNSYKILLEEFSTLFHKTTNPYYPIRQIAIGFEDVVDELYETYDLFTDYEALQKEKNLQFALLDIKEKFGKNAIFKGMNKLEKATTIKRNKLVGGHNAQ